MSIEPVPWTHTLDEFLRDIVRALHAAVNKGIAAARTDPAETDRALADCTEMVHTVMEGQVHEWIDNGPPATGKKPFPSGQQT